MNKLITSMLAVSALAVSMHSSAIEITAGVSSVDIPTEDGVFTITRQAVNAAKIEGNILPMRPIAGIGAVAELEIIDILKNPEGWVILDHRSPEAFAESTIPNAINAPASSIASEASKFSGKKIVSFAYGAHDKDAVTAMQGLIDAGIPASDINYYRGGSIMWDIMGLYVAD